MKPDELVALAAAHGIDIAHTVACETRTDGAARKRRMTPEELKAAHGRPITDTVEGRESRVIRPRYWTHAETGMGAMGLKRMPWLAACYSWQGDLDHYAELHRGLTLEALKLATRHKWAWRVGFVDGRQDHYIERLTELVLDEEACKSAFLDAPGLYAIYLGVTQATWQKPLFACFLSVQQSYQRWLDIASGTIGPRLRSEPRDVAIATVRS